jgi:hypothetical protein
LCGSIATPLDNGLGYASAVAVGAGRAQHGGKDLRRRLGDIDAAPSSLSRAFTEPVESATVRLEIAQRCQFFPDQE